MKRLVLIGNGFDIAHGLPSSYEHFLLWLINNSIEDLNKQSENSVIYKQLFSLKKTIESYKEHNIYSELTEFKSDRKINKYKNFIFCSDPSIDLNQNLQDDSFSFTINSKLFDDLIFKKNWTDIEKGYFDILSTIYKKHGDRTSVSSDLEKLNADFEFLKGLFLEYIKGVNENDKNYNEELKYQIEKCCEDYTFYDLHDSIRKRQILKRFENSQIESITFINFNYTNILNKYILNISTKNGIIPIHGQIFNPRSIVFGYGDEMTEFYKKLENLDDENVLKHFKSHYYHYNDNYSKLLFEVENFEFDVVVFGHSLGLSDKVLLNTIFEHANCKAIHLFHSGGDSHFRKRIALSRHFDDKKAFRKKLMEENDFLKVERR